jgi:simple sugar transport system permease protein
MSNVTTTASTPSALKSFFWRLISLLSMPALAMLVAFFLGALVIWITSGSLITVGEAYLGLIRGAFFKQRGFSETLVATVPYILLSLALAVSFKTGLFNIGAEGQFYMGAISAAWAGQITTGLPAIIHMPLAIAAGALGGALWAAIPGYLKAKTGAHEVISTMMMNYLAFRLTEFLISRPLRDQTAGLIQTPRVSPEAELWTLAAIPGRLQNPLNALFVALAIAFLVAVISRQVLKTPRWSQRIQGDRPRRLAYLGIGLAFGLLTFLALPPLTRAWWPFQDQYDRLHIGLFMALLAAVGVWWLLWKTTLGFELRTVGANPNAARYAGMSITRNIVLAMAISGALAGVAGTVEVLGVSICRCLPLFFSSGYGWDAIAITLVAKNDPFGILGASLLFGAMRNGADLMELQSGVSKYIISVIQGMMLLLVAAPGIVRWIFRIKAERKLEEEALQTRGWGGS